MSYTFPPSPQVSKAEPGAVYTVASGDLRPAANVKCWPTQAKLEDDLSRAVTGLGYSVVRAHPVDSERATASSTPSAPVSRYSNTSRRMPR